MKKILLITFTVMAVCLTSCKKASQPEYRDDAFDVCKGYLNQAGEDVKNKLEEDWGEGTLFSGENYYEFKAKYEIIKVVLNAGTKKVYKADYSIKLPNSNRDKANNYIKDFSQKVCAFYTTDNPTNNSRGSVETKAEDFTSNNHNDFTQSLNAHMNDYKHVAEEWEDEALLCQKTWNVDFDEEKKDVRAAFILDLSKAKNNPFPSQN